MAFQKEIDSDDEWEKHKDTYKEEDPNLKIKAIMEAQFNRLRSGKFESDDSDDVKAKRKELKEKLEKDKEFLNKSYIVEFRFTGIKPRIFRRLQIPGDMNLHSLHDKVLGPAMGWCRNYHSYYFQQLPPGRKEFDKVGVCFGPLQSQAVDVCHINLSGIDLLESRDYKVGQFLQKKGDKLRYVYDYGDNFEHKLTVEEVIDPVGDQVGAVEVLGGAGACPPEDGGGNESYLKSLQKLAAGGRKAAEENANICNAGNYRGQISKFDPTEFSLKLAKRRVMQALQSKTSKMDDSNMVHYDMTGMNQHHFPTFPQTTMLSKKPSDKCPICTKASSLKCGKCKIVYYCSRDHQVEDWPAHKKICRKETSA